jgi:hypothetical protein
MSITWGSSKGRNFQVDNYPRWHDDYHLISLFWIAKWHLALNGHVAESIHILIDIYNS